MYERVWKIKCARNGFTYCIMIRTTEEKLRRWMETELPGAVSYRGASEEEEEQAAKVLGLSIYCYWG